MYSNFERMSSNHKWSRTKGNQVSNYKYPKLQLQTFQNFFKLYHHDFFYPLRLKSHRFKILWLKVEISWHPYPSCCMYVTYNFVFSFIQVGKVGCNKMYIWDVLRLPRHAEGHLPDHKINSFCSSLFYDVRWIFLYIYWLGKTVPNYSNIVRLEYIGFIYCFKLGVTSTHIST